MSAFVPTSPSGFNAGNPTQTSYGFCPQVGCSAETGLVLLSASFSECDPQRTYDQHGATRNHG
jgi:hypothetical protein